MFTDKNQTDSSQLTICVKDLYKPIQHHNYNRKDLPSFRFKFLVVETVLNQYLHYKKYQTRLITKV